MLNLIVLFFLELSVDFPVKITIETQTHFVVLLVTTV